MLTEFVLSRDVFKYIDAEYPQSTHTELARIVGVDESGLRRKRMQSKIKLTTADTILTKLDLSHLLSDGSIPVYHGYVNSNLLPGEKAEEQIRIRREKIRKLELEIETLVKSLEEGERGWLE